VGFLFRRANLIYLSAAIPGGTPTVSCTCFVNFEPIIGKKD